MKSHLLDITIVGTDQIGILAKITTFFANNHINITNISQSTTEHGVRLTFSLDTRQSKLSTKELLHQLNDMCQTMHLQATLQTDITES